MRYPILAAAMVLAGTTGLHIIEGGAEFHVPIQRSQLDPALGAMSAVLWHFVTLMLALQAAALVWLALHPERGMTALLVAVQVGFAGLFLYYGQTMLGTVWQLGQWMIFLAIAVLILWGQFRAERAR